MPQDCPFCSPNVEKACFAASENFRAIYNIAPILPGHSLIIPKLHIERFLDLPDEHLAELMTFSKKVMIGMQGVFNTDGFDFTIQDGEAAGQTVAHTHAHIIPRYKNDLPEPGDWYPTLKSAENEIIDSLKRPRHSDEEMHQIISELSNMLKACL